MATCPSCGASVEGDLCTKCGALVGVGHNVPGSPKKSRMVYWIVGGCLGLIVIAILAVVVGGYLFVRRTGVTSELLTKQPAHAVAQIMTKTLPNLEVVSIDESTGIIRFRDKQSGKIMVMNSKVPGSRPTFEDEPSAALPPAKDLPDHWFPIYPGNAHAKGAQRGSGSFETYDSSETVAAYYENYFKGLGFSVQKSFNPFPSGKESIKILANDANEKHRVNIKAARSGDAIKVSYEFETKE
jgi:hypothetical protein